MVRRDLIVVAASAGGVEALTTLVRGLPADLPAAVVVVLHVPAAGTSVLPQLLARAGPLPAAHPQHGDALRAGHILVAPPDRHLLIEDGHVLLSQGPRENGHRPAADPLFRSAARTRGRRVIGVVLSGALDDGTAGLLALRARGGVAVVQDPDDALYPGMPSHAIALGVDYVQPVAQIPATLVALLQEEVGDAPPGEEDGPALEDVATAGQAPGAYDDPARPGRPSPFSCPTCAGVLWEINEQGLERYRCRLGHAWSPATLLAEQRSALEGALWSALRSLEEKAALVQRMAERARSLEQPHNAERYAIQAEDDRTRAELLRRLLTHDGHALADLLSDHRG